MLMFAVVYLFLLCLSISLSWSLTYVHVNTSPRVHSMRLENSNKDAFRDEQLRIQQEMLNRRKDKSKMTKYFDGVEQRRKDVSKETAEKIWRNENASKDPLNKWLEAKKKGKINPLGYEPGPKKADSKLGLNIVIPLNPIGTPKYDNGERFDLRLPYAETGYEDPESDVMAKFMNVLKGIFGGNKKSPTPPSSKNTVK